MISARTAGAAATLLLTLGSYWGMYQHGRSVERADWEVRWAERAAADSAGRAQAEAQAREEEQRRAAAQDEARANAQAQQKAADTDAAGADAAGQRLRDEAGKLAVAVSCPGPDTTAVARGEAARRAAMVLSDLFSRADQRAGELAKAYDDARIAGLACESTYNSLMQSRGRRSDGFQ